MRKRLLTVALLGVFTAALSAVALYRAIGASAAQRVERARDAVTEEVNRLVAVGPDALATPPTLVGLRGGLARDAAEIVAGVPAERRPAVARMAGGSLLHGAVETEAPLAGAQLVGRMAQAPGARLAWSAIAVRPSPYLQSWRILVVALTVSALLLVGNALYALLTVGRAEARRIEERMARDLARQERLAALGRVVAGVAHEVRNPLASIKLRLDLAVSEDGAAAPSTLSPAARRAIAHASSEITRLDRLVADLLIVSGRPLGPRRALALGELARARAEALAPWAALRGVTINASGDGDTASAEPDAVARALDNLLRNAVEASPDGGRVELRVEEVHEVLHIAVEDRGPGVPAARGGELFEPFFTTKADGTGLGLAISRAVARAHGGDVLYARDGEVTRFELILPAAGPAEAEAARASSPSSPSSPSPGTAGLPS